MHANSAEIGSRKTVDLEENEEIAQSLLDRIRDYTYIVPIAILLVVLLLQKKYSAKKEDFQTKNQKHRDPCKDLPEEDQKFCHSSKKLVSQGAYDME